MAKAASCSSVSSRRTAGRRTPHFPWSSTRSTGTNRERMKSVSLLLLAVLVCPSCTTRYQVRGTETIYDAKHPLDIDSFVLKPSDTPDTQAVKKARQTSMEHQSVEYF